VKSIRNLCGLLLVLLSFSAARAEFRPDLAGIELDRVTLTVDREILNPVHEKEAKGKLTLTVLVNQNSVRHSLAQLTQLRQFRKYFSGRTPSGGGARGGAGAENASTAV